MVRAHYEASLAFYGADLGRRVIRKHLGWYMDRADTPPDMRKRILTAPPDEVRSLLAEALLRRAKVAA